MFCVRCGSEIVNGNAFCGKCGAPVGSEQNTVNVVLKDTSNQWQMHCPRCGKGGLQAQCNNKIVSSTTLSRKLGKRHAIGGTSYNSISETYWFCNSCGMKFRDLDELQAIILQQHKAAKGMKIFLIVTLIVMLGIGVVTRMMGDGGLGLKVMMWIYLILFLPLFGGLSIWSVNDAKKKEVEYNNLLPKVKGNKSL